MANKKKNKSRTSNSFAESVRDTTFKKEEKKRKEIETEAEEAAEATFKVEDAFEADAIPGHVEITMKKWEVEEIINEINTYLGSFRKSIYKAKLITFLCGAAISEDIAAYLEKDLPKEVTSLNLWKSKDMAYKVAGMLGAAILSNDYETMSVTMKALKDMWVKKNGGYKCLYATRLYHLSIPDNWAAMEMRNAKKLVPESTKNGFKAMINSKVPELRFKEVNRILLFMVRIRTYTIKFIKALTARVPEDTIAMIQRAIGSVCLVLAWVLGAMLSFNILSGKMQGKGLIDIVVGFAIRVSIMIIYLLFGSDRESAIKGVLIITIVTIVIRSSSNDGSSEEERERRILKEVRDAVASAESGAKSYKVRKAISGKSSDPPSVVVADIGQSLEEQTNCSRRSLKDYLEEITTKDKLKASSSWGKGTKMRRGLKKRKSSYDVPGNWADVDAFT